MMVVTTLVVMSFFEKSSVLVMEVEVKHLGVSFWLVGGDITKVRLLLRYEGDGSG